MQEGRGDKSSILYVEDDTTNREIVKLYLKDSYLVDTASDSEEALKKAGEKKYAVILLDICLCKGMDGIELAREIKKMKKHKDTPVIAVTARASNEDERFILQGGCNHYVSKPFNKKTLLDKINSVLAK